MDFGTQDNLALSLVSLLSKTAHFIFYTDWN